MAGVSNLNTDQIKNGNGKREHDDFENDQECMPMPKRINNHHISPEHILHNQIHPSSINYINRHSEAGPSLSIIQAHGHPFFNYPTHSYQNSVYLDNINSPNRNIPPHLSYEQQALIFQQNQNLHHQALPMEMEMARSVAYYQNPDAVSHNIPVDDPRERNFFPIAKYRPSLDQNDNPHYFEANRTLFDLYLERLARQNQSPHPDVFHKDLQP